MASSHFIGLTAITAFIAVVLGIFGAIAFGMFYSLPVLSFFVPDASKAGNTVDYVIGCSNSTPPGAPSVVDIGDTLIISYGCPVITGRECVAMTCLSNGMCEEDLIAGAQCSQDVECYDMFGPKYVCNIANCSCVLTPSCTLDGDCMVFDPPLDQCLEVVCQSGVCTQRLAPLANCSQDEQCVQTFGDGFQCDLDICECVPTPWCVENVDCLTLSPPLDKCVEVVCVAGFCVEQLAGMANCSASAQCVETFGDGYQCDLATCTCVTVPSCVNDEDCPVPITACTEFVCNSGICEEQLAPGANCSSNWDCISASASGYTCDLDTCGCVAGPECATDQDCPTPINTCTEYVCNAGVCEQELIGGASCYSTEQCQQDIDTGFYCNITSCDCEIFVAPNTTLGCNFDLDCPLLLNNCSEFTCVDNRCEETLKMGSNCSSDEVCRQEFGDGYGCDFDTCGCIEIGGGAPVTLSSVINFTTTPTGSPFVADVEYIKTGRIVVMSFIPDFNTYDVDFSNALVADFAIPVGFRPDNTYFLSLGVGRNGTTEFGTCAMQTDGSVQCNPSPNWQVGETFFVLNTVFTWITS